MLYKPSNVVKKKQHGQFFTHPLIAHQIVREICEAIVSESFWKPLLSLKNVVDFHVIERLLDRVLEQRFVDPAMGDGVFLIEVIRYFEEFLIKLWDFCSSSPYQDFFIIYFKQKIALNFSLVGKRDPLAMDIWKFHIIRTMVYGVDLDSKIVQKARNRIIQQFNTPEITKIAKIVIQLNLKVGNSLISPIRMEIKAKNDLFSKYPSEITSLLSYRSQFCKIHWSKALIGDLVSLIREYNETKNLLKNKILNEVVTKPFFSFLFDDTINPDQVLFLWELEFPEVFFGKEYGFNAIVGNPPWDKWKLYDREWLGSTAIGRADYAQKITTIQKFDNESYSKYLKLKEFYKNTTEYFNQYFQWQPGEKNLFKLFFERFFNLCCVNGYLGVILPGGFLGEYYSQPLRRVLLKEMRVHLIIEFVSNKEIFPDAEAGLSILVILAQKKSASIEFPFIKGILSIEALERIKVRKLSNTTTNIIYFAQNDILMSSPKCIVPAVRNQFDLKIIRKITKFPSLASNKWGCKTSRGVDMTNDRDLLVKNATPFPLIEGRHLVRLGFDNTHPRYWIRSFEEYKRKIPFWDKTIIAWKNFSGNHRRRRMRIAILPPKSVISNSVICLYNFPSIPDVEFYLAGIMCSIPFEFRIRQLCYGININQYIMDGMTVPLFDSTKELHQNMVSVVKNFIPLGKEWAKRKMEASSTLSKARLEADYLDTVTKFDALAAVIYKLTKKEFEVTLKAHPLLELSYYKRTLDYFDFFSV
ncbi:MAG: Eco57I restriction-modification methylase domain-containing protein [Candidatus Thorarchaeota archaeon]